jgi:hypothetical protein
MKYIRTYESFKNKSKQSVNEEFLGSLFKKLKNSLSMGFSKMFGSAAKVDEIIEEYEKELKAAKRPYLENWTKWLKEKQDSIDGKEGDESAKSDEKQKLLDQLNQQNQKLMKLYNDNREKIKQKFDLKIKDATADEDNPKIKNYINLKKLELEQRLIQDEIKEISDMTGMSDDELKNDKSYQEKLKGFEQKIVDIEKSQKEESSAIENKDEEKPEIKEGDTVEYKSEKDEDKTFTNKVKSVSDDEVEIETKDSGTIKRKIVDVKKVEGDEKTEESEESEEKPEIKEGDTVEYKSEKDETKTFTNKVKSVSDDEVEIETKDGGTIKRKIVDVKKVAEENEENK